jgi:hypothetical protein
MYSDADNIKSDILFKLFRKGSDITTRQKLT